MFDRVAAWCAGWAVGHAGPEECDRLGMTAALRLATRRALGQLAPDLVPDAVVLDGTFDFVSPPGGAAALRRRRRRSSPPHVRRPRPVEAPASALWAPAGEDGHRRRRPLRVGGGRLGARQGDP